VSFYGVYDFTDLAKFLAERVFKSTLEEDRARWEQASPISHVGQTSTDGFATVVTHEPRRRAMRKRAVATVVGLLGVMMLLGVTSAEAAPKNGLTFEVTCPGSAPFTIVTPPGNGAFTPAFGPNQVFIPYDVEGTVTADGMVVETFHDIKPAPVPAGAVSCAFETSFEDDGFVIVISGTALVVPRP
jgi:hypothetical protein